LEIPKTRYANLWKSGKTWPVAGDVNPEAVSNLMDVREAMSNS
jgi:hypothetical protein